MAIFFYNFQFILQYSFLQKKKKAPQFPKLSFKSYASLFYPKYRSCLANFDHEYILGGKFLKVNQLKASELFY